MLPIEPPSRLVPEPRLVPVGEPVEMLRVGGDVYSLPDAATLQRWILEQRVSRSDMVSQHGMRWTALGDRAEFAIFFTAVDALPQPAAGPTLEPLPSPLAPPRLQMPMADDEEIYVQDLGPIDGGNPPTEFVAAPPPPELSPFPPTDEPTVGLGPRPGPLDELPVGMLLPPRHPVAEDEPETLLELAPRPSFQAEAHSLGFRLGPDPDTMEATMEATRVSPSPEAIASDPTEEFMRTGNFGELDLAIAPPPLVLPSGRVPVTVAPALGRSVLDEDVAAAKPVSNTPMFAAAGVAALVLVALVAWYALPNDAATTTVAEAPRAQPSPVAVAPAPKPVVPPPTIEKQPAVVAVPPEPVPTPRAAPGPTPKPALVAPPKPALVAKAAPPPPTPIPREAATPKPVVAPIPVKAGGSARTLADQGWKAMDRGDIDAAHGLFAKALQKDPTAGWALYGRGYANEKLGDRVSARVDYCSALAGAGADPELSRELAGGLRRLNAGC